MILAPDMLNSISSEPTSCNDDGCGCGCCEVGKEGEEPVLRGDGGITDDTFDVEDEGMSDNGSSNADTSSLYSSDGGGGGIKTTTAVVPFSFPFPLDFLDFEEEVVIIDVVLALSSSSNIVILLSPESPEVLVTISAHILSPEILNFDVNWGNRLCLIQVKDDQGRIPSSMESTISATPFGLQYISLKYFCQTGDISRPSVAFFPYLFFLNYLIARSPYRRSKR